MYILDLFGRAASIVVEVKEDLKTLAILPQPFVAGRDAVAR
jgi:hypothetical protein